MRTQPWRSARGRLDPLSCFWRLISSWPL